MNHTAKSLQLERCIALEFYAISLSMHMCMHYYSFGTHSAFCNSIVLEIKSM